jgi:hypothetical protein
MHILEFLSIPKNSSAKEFSPQQTEKCINYAFEVYIDYFMWPATLSRFTESNGGNAGVTAEASADKISSYLEKWKAENFWPWEQIAKGPGMDQAHTEVLALCKEISLQYEFEKDYECPLFWEQVTGPTSGGGVRVSEEIIGTAYVTLSLSPKGVLAKKKYATTI